MLLIYFSWWGTLIRYDKFEWHRYSLNSNLKWKYHKEVTGKSTISLPTSFEELFIRSKYAGDNVVILIIPSVAIKSTNEVWNASGGYLNVNFNGANARYNVSKTNISLLFAYNNGQAFTDSCVTEVYYR